MRNLLIIMALAAPCQVDASRDGQLETVEVSAGSHFVANKTRNVEVQKHSDSADPVPAADSAPPSDAAPAAVAAPVTDAASENAAGAAAVPKTGSKMTPEMRAEVATFAKMAVAALNNKADPSMSHEDKAKSVQKALAQAANAMTLMASMADLKKHPDIAKQLESFKRLTATVPEPGSLVQESTRPVQLESPKSPSLIEEHHETDPQTANQATESGNVRSPEDAKLKLDASKVKDGKAPSKDHLTDPQKGDYLDDRTGVEGKLHDLRRMAGSYGGPIQPGSMTPPVPHGVVNPNIGGHM